MLELLPALREHVSLRNVEIVTALPPAGTGAVDRSNSFRTQTLAARGGAIEGNPYISVADLLNPPVQPEPKAPSAAADFPQHIQTELADLIQLCFPDMPRMSAETLAF